MREHSEMTTAYTQSTGLGVTEPHLDKKVTTSATLGLSLPRLRRTTIGGSSRHGHLEPLDDSRRQGLIHLSPPSFCVSILLTRVVHTTARHEPSSPRPYSSAPPIRPLLASSTSCTAYARVWPYHALLQPRYPSLAPVLLFGAGLTEKKRTHARSWPPRRMYCTPARAPRGSHRRARAAKPSRALASR